MGVGGLIEELVVLSRVEGCAIPLAKQYFGSLENEYQSYRKPGIGMIEVAKDSIWNGDKWDVFDQPQGYVADLAKVVGLCDRPEDFKAMSAASIDSYDRANFVKFFG